MTKSLSEYTPNEIKAAVADRYGQVATVPGQKFNFPVGRGFAESVGYGTDLLDRLPPGMWESFTGAGNPQPFVDARPGETLLDLGCGAGLDLFLYSQKIGPTGRLFGLDLSRPMLNKAQANLDSLGVSNAEWLNAPADAIPLPDNSVDIVTANGIYNLSPDKDAVMREVFRVLKPGGRTIFAEIVLKSELPQEVRREINDWFRCIGGALVQVDFLSRLRSHGLVNPQVLWLGRNARTGHELAVCAVIRAQRCDPTPLLTCEARMKPTTLGLVFSALLAVSSAVADEHDEGITLNYPDKLEWKDGPPSLPKGAKFAVLEGDLSKEGPFVFRVKAPDGYRIPPHTHPKMERVTVISGTFNIGMGKTFDQKATKAMTAGTYGYWEPEMEHFVWIKGETVAQFHGNGPWVIKYVDPKDDPRNQAKDGK